MPDDVVPHLPIHGRRGFREHIDPTRFPVEGMPAEEVGIPPLSGHLE